MQRRCKEPECDKPNYCHKMCKRHYQRWYEENARPPRKKAIKHCEVSGCDNMATSNVSKYCAAHKYQMRKHGKVVNPIVHHPQARIHNPLYGTWLSMRDRCYNEKNRAYKNYGGRGIKVCDRWKEDFLAFLQDMGERPGPEYSLDRVDVNGDYSPENCRWATRYEQNCNKRTNSAHPCVFTRQRGAKTQWVVRIKHNGVCRTRVRKTLELAIAAREELASEMGVA